MARDIRILSLLTMPAVLFIGFAKTEPQLRLLARIWGGELRAEAVPVFDFEPPGIPAKGRIVRIGCLSFYAPTTETGKETVQLNSGGVRIEADGLCALVFRPVDADVMWLPVEYLDLAHIPSDLAQDPGALRAAAYAAGSQDLSIWMKASEVDSLEALLEAKTVLCAPLVTRVERVSGPHLSGVLIIREHDEFVHMVLEYFSRDVVGRDRGGPVGGIASLVVDPADPEAMHSARAIIGSFVIDRAQG